MVGLATVDVISFTRWYFTNRLPNKKRYQVTGTQLVIVPHTYVKFLFGEGGDSLEVPVTCGYYILTVYFHHSAVAGGCMLG